YSHFFFNATTTTDIYTLSLHDALPILALVTGASRGIGRGIALALARAGCDVAVNYREREEDAEGAAREIRQAGRRAAAVRADVRSEEHTSELQSPYDLVCRLLLEKKKK